MQQEKTLISGSKLGITIAAMAAALMAILDAQLADRPFLAGERFGVADIAVGCGAHRWLNMPVERVVRPHVQRWYEALFARPAAKAALPLPIT